MASSRLKKGGAVAGAAISFIVGWEGMKLVPYKDVVGVWTVCAGWTHNVDRARKYTAEECRRLTIEGGERYALAVERCVTRRMPDSVFIAFFSLAYNIGEGGFCKSSVARLWNAGRARESCDFMLRYNRAGGIVWRGLTNRRTAERGLCLQMKDLG